MKEEGPRIAMPAPEMHIKEEEELMQFDSTLADHSTTRPVKEEGREDLAVRRPLRAALIFPVKSL